MCSPSLIPGLHFSINQIYRAQKPGDTSRASQFNAAHYGNQLNAEEPGKCQLSTNPSRRLADSTGGGSLGAPLSHSALCIYCCGSSAGREEHLHMKGLSKGLPVLGEGGQRQVQWEQGLGASEAQCTLTTQAAATSCPPGQCTLCPAKILKLTVTFKPTAH